MHLATSNTQTNQQSSESRSSWQASASIPTEGWMSTSSSSFQGAANATSLQSPECRSSSHASASTLIEERGSESRSSFQDEPTVQSSESNQEVAAIQSPGPGWKTNPITSMVQSYLFVGDVDFEYEIQATQELIDHWTESVDRHLRHKVCKLNTDKTIGRIIQQQTALDGLKTARHELAMFEATMNSLQQQ